MRILILFRGALVALIALTLRAAVSAFEYMRAVDRAHGKRTATIKFKDGLGDRTSYPSAVTTFRRQGAEPYRKEGKTLLDAPSPQATREFAEKTTSSRYAALREP